MSTPGPGEVAAALAAVNPRQKKIHTDSDLLAETLNIIIQERAAVEQAILQTTAPLSYDVYLGMAYCRTRLVSMEKRIRDMVEAYNKSLSQEGD